MNWMQNVLHGLAKVESKTSRKKVPENAEAPLKMKPTMEPEPETHATPCIGISIDDLPDGAQTPNRGTDALSDDAFYTPPSQKSRVTQTISCAPPQARAKKRKLCTVENPAELQQNCAIDMVESDHQTPVRGGVMDDAPTITTDMYSNDDMGFTTPKSCGSLKDHDDLENTPQNSLQLHVGEDFGIDQTPSRHNDLTLGEPAHPPSNPALPSTRRSLTFPPTLAEFKPQRAHRNSSKIPGTENDPYTVKEDHLLEKQIGSDEGYVQEWLACKAQAAFLAYSFESLLLHESGDVFRASGAHAMYGKPAKGVVELSGRVSYQSRFSKFAFQAAADAKKKCKRILHAMPGILKKQKGPTQNDQEVKEEDVMESILPPSEPRKESRWQKLFRSVKGGTTRQGGPIFDGLMSLPAPLSTRPAQRAARNDNAQRRWKQLAHGVMASPRQQRHLPLLTLPPSDVLETLHRDETSGAAVTETAVAAHAAASSGGKIVVQPWTSEFGGSPPRPKKPPRFIKKSFCQPCPQQTAGLTPVRPPFRVHADADGSSPVRMVVLDSPVHLKLDSLAVVDCGEPDVFHEGEKIMEIGGNFVSGDVGVHGLLAEGPYPMFVKVCSSDFSEI